MSRLLTAVVVAGVVTALVLWVLSVRQPDDEVPPVVAEMSDTPPVEPAPQPVAPPPVAAPPPAPLPAAPALPKLADSDPAVLAALRERADPGLIERLLVPDALVRRIVATVDNLPRRNVSMKVRAVPAASERFLVTGDEDGFYLDPANYARYRGHVRLLSSVAPAEAATLYARYYPLLQEAYVELGYPDATFHARLISVIDELLATPEVTGPIRLIRPHVLYRFADPDLEALSAGQKMLLRAGPEHAGQVKAWLRAFRAALTRTAAPAGARVFFVAPANGATVTSPVRVEFGVEGMTIVRAGEQRPASGHHHLIVDAPLPDPDRPIPASERYIHFGDGATSTELTLAPGEHTLTLLLGDHAHVPHLPPVRSETITIDVVR